jgi:pyruvate/2-oxoglutarate dehydrogenase complex dihydrolipoamide dehydrogenase (E3) component
MTPTSNVPSARVAPAHGLSQNGSHSMNAPSASSVDPHILRDLQPLDEHNVQLLEAVHPPTWTNPTPSGRYNMVVIGGGTAGLVTAAGAAGLGAKVALIERRLLGGDCLNFGCVPSKALIRSARSAGDLLEAHHYGVKAGSGFGVDFPAVMERMRRLRAQIGPHDSAERFRSLGIDVFIGDARFTGLDTIEVAGQTLRFARACIATGARPATPAIPGLAEAGFLNNENVFTLTELPPRLAVLGSGPIGCELAQCFARFGSTVTVIEQAGQVLPREDRDAAEFVIKAMGRDNVTFRLNASVVRVERSALGKTLVLKTAGGEERLEVDEILVGIGRAPNVEGMGLEAAGVKFDARKGVEVTDRLRTTNPRIYAAGDVCSKYKFTHAADAMARIVIQNALFFGWSKASRLVMPWCTFTDPEIAHVGMYEKDAQEQGIATDTIAVELGKIDRAILDGEDGLLKVLLRKGSDQILGATLVSRHAGETISELTTAITHGIGLRKLASVIHPYPTQAEVIKRAADAYNRTRLTPVVKKLFERVLAWRR